MAEFARSGWAKAFDVMMAEWRSITPPTPMRFETWEVTFASLKAEQASLESRGRWRGGPADLLHVAGLAGDELVHSAVLAWLLKPSATHGLGPALLTAILRETWDLDLPGPDVVTVRREVERRDGGRWRRADVVVTAGALTLVVENKVYSDESEGQCEDLYRLFTQRVHGQEDADRDVRFVLLSRHGRMPWSVATDEARIAWRPLSYHWLARWLADNLALIDSPVARSTVVQYLIALRPVAGVPGGR